jgi:hypothetical protein
MADAQSANAPAANEEQKVEQEASWLGARLREKSTYGGLTVVISLLLPVLAHYLPALMHADPNSIVSSISMIGIGVGGLIAILLPEKGGNVKRLAVFLAVSAALALGHPAAAQTRHAAKSAALRGPLYDATKAPAKGKAQLTAQQVAQNPIALLQQFTVNDLNNAIALANSQSPPDTVSLACWNALLPLVKAAATTGAAGGAGNPLQVGGATGIQDVRDGQAILANLQSPTGPLAGVNTVCAPVLVSLQTTLSLLGIQAGFIAAGVTSPAAAAGAAGAITTLQGLFALVPKL